MNKIDRPQVGIITYHAGYNFGSVLQAYATQQTLEKLGYASEIIDYRTPSQTQWYNSNVITDSLVSLIKTIGLSGVRKERAVRRAKYEEFISRNLRLTEKRYTAFEQIREEQWDYPILLSGSDQIWNLSCGEFAHESGDAIRPYFLDFGNPQKRIAYASSIGTQTLNYVKGIKPYLDAYDFLSSRETVGCRYLSKVTGREVTQVVDPTWLLDKNEWEIPGVFNPSPDRPYIFVYTLNMWNRSISGWFEALREIASKRGWDIYCVSPITYVNVKGVRCIQDAGPLDILSYIRNAALVVTNTFHGTIFSVNHEIPFFSIMGGVGSRQQQILELCDLEDRLLSSPGELSGLKELSCDFSVSQTIVKKKRMQSIEYLKESLG